MQTMNQLNPVHLDQRYLVVGLGLTGYSVAHYLLQHGYDCSVQDDRNQPPYLERLLKNHPGARVILQELTESMIQAADCLVVSPGISIRSPLLKKVAESGKRIIGDIELFAEAATKPVLAITGSNGKSTVTSLLGEMIKADGKAVGVGGNIGLPALELLARDHELDFYVLELSSFQLETTSHLELMAATVLNVSEDHMDRYENLQDYQDCKKTIYHNARVCISNLDDELTRYGTEDLLFSITSEHADYHLLDGPPRMLAIRGQGIIDVSQLKLKGRHNWANCLAAIALADQVGISVQAMQAALQSFSGLDHRSQWVARHHGVDWINDSKATNPGATLAAIEGIDESLILLAGGQGKSADMGLLRGTLKQHVKQVVVYGEDAAVMLSAWQDCVAVQIVDTLSQAVTVASQIAQPGDVVMLSPACASFDQYPGFEARGDHFCELVRSLP